MSDPLVRKARRYANPLTTTSRIPRRYGQGCLEIVLIFAIFVVVGGDLVPHVNEPHYLCRLKHFWDPDWAKGDLFLESSDAHLAIVLTFGALTQWISLAWVAWGGRVVVWLLLAWAWRRLSYRLAPVPFASVLSAALWVMGIGWGHFAGEWVIGGFETKCFAYVFVLLALDSYLVDRWNKTWIYLGAASALHVLVGGWSALILFAWWALHYRAQTDFRSMVPGLAVGGALSLIGFLPALAMNRGVSAETVAQANVIYVFDRLPHHLAPLTKPLEWIALRAGSHLVVLAFLGGATWWARSDPKLLRLCRFAWGAGALLFLGLAIEGALWNHPTLAAQLLRYYWFRLSDVAAPMAVAIVTTSWVVSGLARSGPRSVVVFCIVLAFPCSFLLDTTWRRWSDPTPPADRKMSDPAAWVDVCQWVTENTPRDAIFLVPLHSASFKWRTGRAEVVTSKDIPQNAASIVEWKRRIEAIYRTKRLYPPGGAILPFGFLGAEQIKRQAKNYKIDYFIASRRWPVSLPVAYSENPSYVVYDLRTFRDETTRRAASGDRL